MTRIEPARQSPASQPLASLLSQWADACAATNQSLAQRSELINQLSHPLLKPYVATRLQVTLLGSDGKKYIFLAKPKDDLRKDNRMMEMNGILNCLLAKQPASRRRNLHLRRCARSIRGCQLYQRGYPRMLFARFNVTHRGASWLEARGPYTFRCRTYHLIHRGNRDKTGSR